MSDASFEIRVVEPRMAQVEINGEIGGYTFNGAWLSAVEAKKLRDALDDALEEIRRKWTNRD